MFVANSSGPKLLMLQCNSCKWKKVYTYINEPSVHGMQSNGCPKCQQETLAIKQRSLLGVWRRLGS